MQSSEGGAHPQEDVGRHPLAVAESRRDRREKALRARRYIPSEEELLEDEDTNRRIEARIRATHQVSVRLRPDQWERLLRVAEWSGVPPTTMARILINRGAKAIIDEDLRQWRRYGPGAD
jgi:hypothetical protein